MSYIIPFIEARPVLASALKYVILNNKTNFAPYHNLHHMTRVTYHSHRIISHDYSNILSNNQINDVLIACLFHDMNHSLGKLPDSENILNAVTAFQNWYELSEDASEVDPDAVVGIIAATEYPYVIPADKLTDQQKIIRDADLMISMDNDVINTIVIGLKEEMGVDSVLDVVKGNIKFHENIKFNTEYGQVIYETNWKPLITLRSLKNILENDN